jgi:hypothetical protein
VRNGVRCIGVLVLAPVACVGSCGCAGCDVHAELWEGVCGRSLRLPETCRRADRLERTSERKTWSCNTGREKVVIESERLGSRSGTSFYKLWKDDALRVLFMKGRSKPGRRWAY